MSSLTQKSNDLFLFFTVMQQSATEKERGRSGQFIKREIFFCEFISHFIPFILLQLELF